MLHFKKSLYALCVFLGFLLTIMPSWAQTTDTSDPKILAYTITRTDRLRISVYQEDDLSVIARVDSKGLVNLPLVGQVKIAGMTVSSAQEVIEKSYRDGRFLRSPQVTINVEEYAPREVSISGEVRSPGRYPLPIESSMTVVELVTRAGGLTDVAKGTAITVTRVDENGEQQKFTVDVDSWIKGKEKAKSADKSLQLMPGDIVYVPQRLI